MGKDPLYPYAPNPINPQLEEFGYSVSAVCTAHHIPMDRLNLTKARL